MKKSNSRKLDLYVYLVVLICVFIMFMGTFLSYYVKTNKEKNKNIIHNSVLMALTFNGKEQVNINNIKPGWNDKLEFSVTNYSSDTIGKYKIVLEIITPLSNMVDEFFVYSVESTCDNKDTTNSLINSSDTVIPVVSKELNGGVITPNTTHNYVINFKLNKNNKKYNNTLFSARVRVEEDK